MAIKGITPFLWYESQAEEAAKLYTSVFGNSRITHVSRYGDGGPAPKGTVMVVAFELAGQRFTALNGGPHYKLSEAFSLLVDCTASRPRSTSAVGRAGRRRRLQCVWLAEGPFRPVLANQLCGPARPDDRRPRQCRARDGRHDDDDEDRHPRARESRRLTKRRLILKMHMSLDGFAGRPDNDNRFIFAGSDDALTDWTVAGVSQAGLHIMGRET